MTDGKLVQGPFGAYYEPEALRVIEGRRNGEDDPQYAQQLEEKRQWKTLDEEALYIPSVEMGKFPPPPDWIWEPYIPRSGYTYFAGPEGSGKTRLMLHLAVARALGREFLGFKTTSGKSVLWLCEEDRVTVGRMLERTCESFDATLKDLDDRIVVMGLRGLTPQLFDSWREYGNQNVYASQPNWDYVESLVGGMNADFLVIDPLLLAIGRVNQNDIYESHQITQRLIRLAIDHDCAVLLSAHPSEAGKLNDKGFFGAITWVAEADSHLYITNETPDDEKTPGEGPMQRTYRLHHRKARHSAAQKPFDYQFDAGVHRRIQISQVGLYELFTRLMDELITQGVPLSEAPTSPYYFVKQVIEHPRNRDRGRAGITRTQAQEMWKRSLWSDRLFKVDHEARDKAGRRVSRIAIGIREDK